MVVVEGEEENEGGTADDDDKAKLAERSYRRWLRSRFCDHARRLRSILSFSGAFPQAQAAAARAALEASRSAVTGRFDAGLFGTCLDALLLAGVCSSTPRSPVSPAPVPVPASASPSPSAGCGSGASAEAVSVVLSKAGFADVRHSLLKGVARCAAALAASFASSASASSASASVAAAAAASSSPPAAPSPAPPSESLSDAASTLFDVLIRVPALPERKGGAVASTGTGDDEDDGASPSSPILLGESWCGGEAVGRAAAASGASGSRERRKRKQRGKSGSGSGGVSWALPREHRRASRLAWQSVLLLPSPALLPADALSSALRALPAALPGMDRPALLCDSLTDAVSGEERQQPPPQQQQGGGGGGGGGKISPSPSSSVSGSFSASAHATAVAALAALFELIVRHGLEYPVRCC